MTRRILITPFSNSNETLYFSIAFYIITIIIYRSESKLKQYSFQKRVKSPFLIDCFFAYKGNKKTSCRSNRLALWSIVKLKDLEGLSPCCKLTSLPSRTKAPMGIQQDSQFIGRFGRVVNMGLLPQIVKIPPSKTTIHSPFPPTTLYPFDYFRIFIA